MQFNWNNLLIFIEFVNCVLRGLQLVRNVKSCVHQGCETSRTGLQTPSGIGGVKPHGRGYKPMPLS